MDEPIGDDTGDTINAEVITMRPHRRRRSDYSHVGGYAVTSVVALVRREQEGSQE